MNHSDQVATFSFRQVTGIVRSCVPELRDAAGMRMWTRRRGDSLRKWAGGRRQCGWDRSGDREEWDDDLSQSTGTIQW